MMNEILIPSLYLLAGIMVYAMFHHFSSAIYSVYAPLQMLFSGMCLLAVPFAIFHIHMLQATDMAGFISALKWNISFAILFMLVFPWFIRLYTGRQSTTFLVVLSSLLSVALMANLIQPFTLQYDQFEGIHRLKLPWGETVTRGDGHGGYWAYYTFACVMAGLGYVLHALVSHYRASRQFNDLCMLFAVVLFLIGATLGLLVRLSVVNFVEPGPVGTLAMVIVMSVALTGETRNRLKNSERHFRSLFENSPTGLVAVDAKTTRIVQTNQAALKMTGFSNEELIGSSVASLTHPDDLDPGEYRRNYEQLSKGVIDRISYEKRYLRKDGSSFIGHSSITALKDEYGQVLSFIASTIDVTESKQAELRSLANEAKWRLLFENMTTGFALHDVICNKQGNVVDYRFIEINPAYEELTGLKAINLVGRTVLEVLPATESYWIEIFGNVALSGEPKSYENYSRELGRWYQVKAFSPKIGQFAVMINDITDRKMAEASLRESEEQLQAIMNASEVAIAWATEDGRIEYANPKFISMFGYTLDEIPTVEQWYLYAYPDPNYRLQVINDWNSKLTQSLTDNSPIETTEVNVTCKDGTVRCVMLYGSWIGTRLLVNITDITERKRTEVALQESETRFRTVIEQSPIGIAFGRNGITIDVNAAYLHMFGYEDVSEVCGQTVISQIAPQCRAEIEDRILRRIQGEPVETPLETIGLRKDGSQFPVYISAKGVTLKDGPLTFGFIIDITEQQQAHIQLQIAADELVQANLKIEEERLRLAERVEERTAQLRLANLAKDSFLATMSHEIRTPLGGLLGMMELLSLSRLDKEQDEILSAAQRSGNSLLRIVNDILDWSKIEAGKLELAPRVASIDDLIKSVAHSYGQIASEKDIRIQVEIDPELHNAHLFDTLRVAQILNNFTSNALKFTQHGSIALSAAKLARHDDSETVRFSVQDSGAGISKDHLARLFEQYEQASADTARMYGGTGLGLSICRRLADMMGGTLSVESEVGVGSTFSFTVSLPVVENAAPDQFDPSAHHQHEPDISPLVTADQHVVVLVVDDHPINRMLLKQQLDKLGVRAVAAADGVEALALWQSRHFDLIITDCHMPEMDGYELSSRIRDMEQLGGGKRIPIIAWTANAMIEEVEHCHAAGMDGLLTKPTELHVLRAKLLKWLVRSGVLT